MKKHNFTYTPTNFYTNARTQNTINTVTSKHITTFFFIYIQNLSKTKSMAWSIFEQNNISIVQHGDHPCTMSNYPPLIASFVIFKTLLSACLGDEEESSGGDQMEGTLICNYFKLYSSLNLASESYK